MTKTLIAATLFALLAAPAFAADEGSGNAEQQTQPTPNRGSTAGGPAHGPDHPKTAPEGTAPDHGKVGDQRAKLGFLFDLSKEVAIGGVRLDNHRRAFEC